MSTLFRACSWSMPGAIWWIVTEQQPGTVSGGESLAGRVGGDYPGPAENVALTGCGGKRCSGSSTRSSRLRDR
jgi:hypothetical protein